MPDAVYTYADIALPRARLRCIRQLETPELPGMRMEENCEDRNIS